jgi:hypothetical protein
MQQRSYESWDTARGRNSRFVFNPLVAEIGFARVGTRPGAVLLHLPVPRCHIPLSSYLGVLGALTPQRAVG